jgi:transcriptional regulator with XRE-family HTH domain
MGKRTVLAEPHQLEARLVAALIEARKRANLSQEALAYLMGYSSENAIWAFERGYTPPSLRYLLKACDVLEIEISELVYRACGGAARAGTQIDWVELAPR